MTTPARVWLRRATAWLLVAGLAAVAGLIGARARTTLRTGVDATPEVPRAEQIDAGPTISDYRGFRFVETIAGQVAFALGSSRTLGTSSGWHEVKDVQLELYQHGKRGGVLTCEAASFNIQTHDTRLNGEIRLQLSDDGITVRTQSGHFEAASRELVTDAETTFMSEKAIGRSARARYSVAENRLELEGGVEILSSEGARLVAPRLLYERAQGRVSMTEGYRLTFSQGTLAGPRAVVRLADQEGRPESIELDGGVVLTGAYEASNMEGWAERLTARRDPSGSWQFQATTSGPLVTMVTRSEATYYRRQLKTWNLRGVVAPAGILTVIAQGGVCLEDIPIQGGPSAAESNEAQAWFVDGEPNEMELKGNVVLRSEELRATGARARLAAATGLAMLHADPSGGQRAVLVTARGTVSGDQVQLHEAEGRADARGDVQGQVEGAALLAGGTQSTTRRPLHFAADELTATDRGDVLELRGHARTWQGRRLLQADHITYHLPDQRLNAEGHVRTIVPAQQLKAGAPAPGDAIVDARSLDYDGIARTAAYVGGVSYADGVRTMSAAELDILFDEENQITSLEALGGVEIVELTTGRRMLGQRARRDCAARTLTLDGSPVQLEDERGNLVSGTSLTWEEASGRVVVSGGPGSPTETIFHPEEGSVLQSPNAAAQKAPTPPGGLPGGAP